MLPAPSHRKLRWVFLLGLLLAFQAAGWYVFWGVLVTDAKISARHIYTELHAPRLHLTIAATDLQRLWVDKREIRLEGRLYDVVRQHLQGDSVCLEVYHDRHEEALFHVLEQLLAGDDRSGTPLRSWLLQWLGGVYVLPRLPALLPPWAVGYPVACFLYRLLSAQYRPVLPGRPPDR